MSKDIETRGRQSELFARIIRFPSFRLVAIAIAGILLCAWFQGQAQLPETPTPTIRVSTHLVLVDVVVTNKQGKSVLDLHPEDFEVEENGILQRLSTFSAPNEGVSARTQLPPGAYSNRAQYTGPIVVILLDALNTPFKDQSYARQQMLRFVQEQHRQGQRVAIFTLAGSFDVLQDFTSDPQILGVALREYKPQPQGFADASRPGTSILSGTPNIATSVTAMDASAGPVSQNFDGLGGARAAQLIANAKAALQAFASAQVAYADDQRAVITLNALNVLCRTLGGLPGRKSVIWVTGALPFSLVPENRDVSEMELAEDLPSLDTRRVGQHAAGSTAGFFRQTHAKEIRDLSARLSNSQVAIYPVDAEGLSISTDADSQEAMREMARETGGRAYVNQNEIKVGVAQAFDDSSATYTLGYYPSNKKWDGQYRQIKVKVNRNGVDVRSRSGYYALDVTQAKGFDSAREVASAMSAAMPSTLVAFAAQVKQPSEISDKGKIGVTFLVDAHTLSAEDSSGGEHLSVNFFASMYSSEGRLLSSESQEVDQLFSPDVFRQILAKGMMLHMDLHLQPQAQQIRLAVQDTRTGFVGSISIPLSSK